MGRRLGRRRKRVVATGGANGNRVWQPYEVAAIASAAEIKVTVDRTFTEQEARALLEKIVWPNGPTCPACGNAGHGSAYDLRAKSTAGVRGCKRCGYQFSARVGTAMESSPLPIKVWFEAIAFLSRNPTMRECEFANGFPKVNYKTAGLMRKRLLADDRLMRGYKRLTMELV